MTDERARRLVIRGLAVAVVLMVIVSGVLFKQEINRIREAKAERAKIMGELPDFALEDQAGRRVGRQDLLGQVSIVSFVFTRCSGSCPPIISRIKQLQDEWASLDRVGFVSVTVDPDYDTPAVLADYGERVGVDADKWRLLTGEPARVYDLIRSGFKASVEPSDGPHEILHSLKLAVVDPSGRIRAYIDSGSGDLKVQASAVVRRLLAET